MQMHLQSAHGNSHRWRYISQAVVEELEEEKDNIFQLVESDVIRGEKGGRNMDNSPGCGHGETKRLLLTTARGLTSGRHEGCRCAAPNHEPEVAA